jgi:hypothetical protein
MKDLFTLMQKAIEKFLDISPTLTKIDTTLYKVQAHIKESIEDGRDDSG